VGAIPSSRQRRHTVAWDNPICAAIERVDQPVAPPGGGLRVASTSMATCSSVTDLGRPDLGSGTSPDILPSANRRRHMPTVARDTLTVLEISVLLNPLAAAKTMWARIADSPLPLPSRVEEPSAGWIQDNSCVRSPSVNRISAACGPRSGMLQPSKTA
jgi:hypothetical protein